MNLLRTPNVRAIRTVLAACTLVAAASSVQAGPVTQSTAATAGSWSYATNWAWQELGVVTLAQGTNEILGLTSTVTLVDQGWGGQDPNNNHVVIGLYEGNTALWFGHVAGATHAVRTETFDITSNRTMFSDLNRGIDLVDWSYAPAVTMRMYAVPLSYGGWQLKTMNASFSVTSAEVPEGSSIALAALGLALLGAVTLRRQMGRNAGPLQNRPY